MRASFGKTCLRQALSAVIFTVLVFGPLGICCHEHEHNHDKAAQGAEHRVCVGICACHFSFTSAGETPADELPALDAVAQRPLSEREPRAQFVSGIDHPPKISIA